MSYFSCHDCLFMVRLFARYPWSTFLRVLTEVLVHTLEDRKE